MLFGSFSRVCCGEAVNVQHFDVGVAAFQPCGRPRRPWRTSAPPWRSFRRGQESLEPVCQTSEPRCLTRCRTPPAPTEQCPPPATPFAPRWPSWGPVPISHGYQTDTKLRNFTKKIFAVLIILCFPARRRQPSLGQRQSHPGHRPHQHRTKGQFASDGRHHLHPLHLSCSYTHTHTTICSSRVTHPSTTHRD